MVFLCSTILGFSSQNVVPVYALPHGHVMIPLIF